MYVLIGLWIGLQMYGNRKIARTDVHYSVGTDKSTSRELLHRKQSGGPAVNRAYMSRLFSFIYRFLFPISLFILLFLLFHYYIIMCF
jgi:hypothetical protein